MKEMKRHDTWCLLCSALSKHPIGIRYRARQGPRPVATLNFALGLKDNERLQLSGNPKRSLEPPQLEVTNIWCAASSEITKKRHGGSAPSCCGVVKGPFLPWRLGALRPELKSTWHDGRDFGLSGRWAPPVAATAT